MLLGAKLGKAIQVINILLLTQTSFIPKYQWKSLSHLQLKMNQMEHTYKVNKKQKQKQASKQPQIKFDGTPYLFQRLRKEHFAKHQNIIDTIAKQRNLEKITQPIGEFAYPLIRSRNEPVFVGYVAEIMCELYDIKDPKDIADFIDLIYENT